MLRKKSVHRAKCVKKSILHRVFRVLAADVQYPGSGIELLWMRGGFGYVNFPTRLIDGVRASLMQPHERSEGLATSLLGRHHECPFVRALSLIAVSW